MTGVCRRYLRTFLPERDKDTVPAALYAIFLPDRVWHLRKYMTQSI